MLEATTYTRIYGQQQLGKCLCVAGGQPTSEKFLLQNYIRIKNFRMFSVHKNIFTQKSELRKLFQIHKNAGLI